MFVKDVNGRFVMVNQHFCDVFGLPADKIVGRTDYDLFPAEVARAYRASDAAVLALGHATETEEPLAALHAAADPVGAWLTAKFPLFDDAGTPFAVGVIASDITDR